MKQFISLLSLLLIVCTLQSQTRNKEMLYDEKGIKLSYRFSLLDESFKCDGMFWKKYKVIARLENESGKDILTGVIYVSHEPFTERNSFPKHCCMCGFAARIKWNTIVKNGNYLEDQYEFLVPRHIAEFPKGDGNDTWGLKFSWVNN
ncbi:hypothetical protein [Lacibacter sp. H407]|uniref:hypothetical protein n=1 Tax=Lacibacter sp. H407 TaxID=3133423 RepID=UPI0030BFFD06